MSEHGGWASPAQPSWPPPGGPAQAPVGWQQPGWGGQPSGEPPRPSGGSARTGPLPLQPMGVGEILDGAIKLYRANFKAIALVSLVLSAPFQVVTSVAVRGANGGYGITDLLNDPSLAQSSGTNPLANLAGSVTLIATTLVGFIVGPLIAGAVAKAVASSYLGAEITAAAALRASLRKWPALLGASLLVHLTEAVGILGCIVGVVFVMGLWVAVSPAIVVEDLGPVAGLRRALQLTFPRYWAVLGIAVLSAVITSTLSSLVSGIPTVAAVLIGYRWGFPLLALAGTASAVLVGPLSAIVATLVYFDLRIRREGFDLEIMAADLAQRRVR